MAEPTGPADRPAPEAPAPEPGPAAPERPRVIDAIVDLLQTTVDWLKQEAEAAVREKVALPLQRVGIAIGSTFAAGCLVVLGVIFVSIALLLLLAQWLTWPGALGLIGGVLLIGAGVFLYIKSRSMVR